MIPYFRKEAREFVSWAQLQQDIINGESPLESFDQILIRLKNAELVMLTVGHDEKGKTYFCFEDCINEERFMNPTWTNEGGWAATDMRRWLNNTFFDLLPDELQAVIKPTRIVQIIDGKQVMTEDNIFLFSKTQMFGKGDWSDIEPEDTHIDIFNTEKQRVKECGKHGTWWYWLRSPNSGNSNYFCLVSYSGNAYNYYASSYRGVAPGFCIA